MRRGGSSGEPTCSGLSVGRGPHSPRPLDFKGCVLSLNSRLGSRECLCCAYGSMLKTRLVGRNLPIPPGRAFLRFAPAQPERNRAPACPSRGSLLLFGAVSLALKEAS